MVASPSRWTLTTPTGRQVVQMIRDIRVSHRTFPDVQNKLLTGRLRVCCDMKGLMIAFETSVESSTCWHSLSKVSSGVQEDKDKNGQGTRSFEFSSWVAFHGGLCVSFLNVFVVARGVSGPRMIHKKRGVWINRAPGNLNV